MMKHITKVDEATAQHYRQQWSFVHPFLLSGRKMRTKKRKVEAVAMVDAGSNGSNKDATATSTPEGGSTAVTATAASKMSDAKARFLQRKLEKARK